MMNLRLQYPVNFKQSNTKEDLSNDVRELQYPVNFKQVKRRNVIFEIISSFFIQIQLMNQYQFFLRWLICHIIFSYFEIDFL